MSIQYQDFAAIAEKSAKIEAPFALANVGVISKLSGLIEELDGMVGSTRQELSGNAADRMEAIGHLRLEFGFAADDAPTAHLRPLATA